jgi:ribonuclease R
MTSQAFAERILKFVQAKGYKPQAVEELARAMRIGEAEWGDFHDACKALMKSGRIVIGTRNAVMLPQPPGRIIGTFRANPRGFGFIIPDTPNAHGDLYVPAGKTGGALTGDTVSARVKKRGKRGGKMVYEGQIVEVLKRGRNRFVGALRREFGRWFVVPDGHTIHVPIMIADPTAKGARPGDQVVVELLDYPSERREARGVIVKVLGRRGEPGVDALSIIEQYGLPGEFEEGVLQAARDAVASFDPQARVKDREDLRKTPVITIDPADARDFDDAISLQRNKDGTWQLGVHIADVAFFVRPGTPLDDEARERANSIYLPRKVIPMLPEVLSNGVCSLQEREPRLAKSVFIHYDKRGNVKSTRFANTIIRSTRRLTYEQATRVLDGRPGRMSARIVTLLRGMESLARTIQARRLREGMLSLDMPEVEIVHNDEGEVIDAVPADTGFSHTIIEMFMVEANEAVSRLLTKKRLPHLRRVHGEPYATSFESLQGFLRILNLDLPDGADRFDIQKLLLSVKETPKAYAVNLAVLRSMQQAEYAPARMGHYALASSDYCHFTSPIRRYPDLTVHRLLDRCLSDRAGPAITKGIPTDKELVDLGNHCSNNERRAEAAERELKEVLILRLLEKHVGERFQGIVTGVANVGVFVQLERYLIEGLLGFDRLPSDWWEIDPSHGAAVGEVTGRQITVGDRLQVAISRVDLSDRQLQLDLIDELPPPRFRKTRRKAAKALKRRTQKASSGSKTARKGRPTRRSRRR